MDREPQPAHTPDAATATAAPSDATTGGGGTQFTNQGAIPGVAAQSGAAGPPAKSASDRAFGAIGHAFKKVGQEAEVIGAETVGVAELAGLRYPVKPYEAQVDSGLYRGSRLDDQSMGALKEMGVKGVVNLCMENNDDAPRAAKLGLQALHVPILDNSAPTVAQMMQFIHFAQANAPTYVHCEAGKGRTGTAVACYRIAVDGWTADQAIAEAQTFGLSLINQIAFIRSFAKTMGQPTAPDATADATKPDAATADAAAPATAPQPAPTATPPPTANTQQ